MARTDIYLTEEEVEATRGKKSPFCFMCGKTSTLVGLLLTATKQNDKTFKNEVYYQVCEEDIPKLIKFLSSKRGLEYFDLWKFGNVPLPSQ